MDNVGRKKHWDMGRRWTPALIDSGFTPVPNIFLAHYGKMNITPAEAMLVLQLMSFKWDEKKPYPSFSRMAKRMSISETAVRGHARNLEKKGFIKRIQRKGRTNEFDLLPLFLRLEGALAVTQEVT